MRCAGGNGKQWISRWVWCSGERCGLQRTHGFSWYISVFWLRVTLIHDWTRLTMTPVASEETALVWDSSGGPRALEFSIEFFRICDLQYLRWKGSSSDPVQICTQCKHPFLAPVSSAYRFVYTQAEYLSLCLSTQQPTVHHEFIKHLPHFNRESVMTRNRPFIVGKF